MITPLADNSPHLQQLCHCLQLGSARGKAEAVPGGMHHRMWKLDTSSGSYAIKQLSPELDPREEESLSRFERSERAVVALKYRGHYLQLIDSAAYLVYPWVSARALHREEITDRHTEQVAGMFAAMHRANVELPGLVGEDYALLSADKLDALLKFARSRNSSRSDELERHSALLLQLADRHREAAGFLAANTVVSHGDMDHKNILWTEDGKPRIIDWESAHRLNPSHEIVLESLDWSGITLDFSESRFRHMLAAYFRAGGRGTADELEAALRCVQGDWLNWLMYNLGRSIDLDDAGERQRGSEQLDLALATLWRLERLLPGLLAAVSAAAGRGAVNV